MSDAYDAIVLGGGAAGLMCALEAGNRGKRVLLIEHNDAVGRKIRISGGGRCNFTNLHTEPDCFISANPKSCHSALSRYTPSDFIAFVEQHGIAYHEKKLGQLFCDGSAQGIIDALLRDCAAANVHIRLECTVRDIEKGDGFVVYSSQGIFRAPALVVATGGLSIPKLGATDFGHQLAARFGLAVVPCAPALVPLTLSKSDLKRLADLSGIAFDAAVTCGNAEFEESVLITHRGLSGPAILQVSSYWDRHMPIEIDLYPGEPIEEELLSTKRAAPATLPRNFLATRLTTRFAQRFCEWQKWSRTLGEIADDELREMTRTLREWRLEPTGTEGYEKAEVTRGGVDTRGLSPKTMESKAVPGLYFIGEVVDVTGWLGGYNFQWAWASGAAAGRAV